LGLSVTGNYNYTGIPIVAALSFTAAMAEFPVQVFVLLVDALIVVLISPDWSDRVSHDSLPG
jgi:hypothetical protein